MNLKAEQKEDAVNRDAEETKTGDDVEVKNDGDKEEVVDDNKSEETKTEDWSKKTDFSKDEYIGYLADSGETIKGQIVRQKKNDV